MPEKLDKCVQNLIGKGTKESSAWAICRTQLGLAEGKTEEEYLKMAEAEAERIKDKKFDTETKDIRDVDIFASGTWNGDKYSEKDLQSIVDTFYETKAVLKPYLKIGHGERQKLLDRDELPAAGYIANLKKVGMKLVADFVNVPKKIYELIKKKAYRRVSSELFVNLNANGKKYPLALKAVSILGGETPAVQTLDDILNLYAIGGEAVVYKDAESTKECELDASQITEVHKMTLEDMTKKVATLEAEIKTLSEENATLEKDFQEAQDAKVKAEEEAKTEKEKADKAESENQQLKEEKKNSEINAKVRELVMAEKVTPHQGDILKEILKNVRMDDKVKSFKIKDKEFNTIDEAIKEFIDAGDVDINTEEETERGETSEFVSKVEKHAKEKGISIKDAMLELSTEK